MPCMESFSAGGEEIELLLIHQYHVDNPNLGMPFVQQWQRT